MQTTPLRTELSELGEFGLIERLTRKVKIRNESTLMGVGDDAAVVKYNDKLTLVSTDLLVEGIHFDLAFNPLKHLGYKAAIVNFSDILAMNGVPRQITVGIAASNRFSAEALDELYEGILMACEKYQVDLVGGDTVSSPRGLFISITVLGEAAEGEAVYRSGAKETDLVCVTGDLGAAYMGLLLLEREKAVYLADPKMQPDLEGYEYILERQLKPELRPELKQTLADIQVRPTAMIDISDGLASEVLHLCHDSGLGVALFEDKIPVDPMTVSAAADFGLDPTIPALNGGEDYELLFTVPVNDFEKMRAIPWISLIGYMTTASEGTNLITRSGQQVPLNAQGWDAFIKHGNR
ncbi:MAG: thiamine-phosphate kinase [Bacteroidetes bacterium]|nr:thiamine-phosphate kinase [Bacteroidota bacterium]